MNIVFVTPEFLVKNRPSTGLPNYLYRVSKALIDLGHHITIITAGELNEDILYENISVIRRNTFTTVKINSDSLTYIVDAIHMNYKLTHELIKLSHKMKIDIVQFSSLYGLGMFYWGKIPSVLRLSSYARQSYKYGGSYSEITIRVISFIERQATRKNRNIFSPSKIMANQYGKDVYRKVHVIESPYFLDNVKWDESEYSRKYKGKKYMLFFGTLYEVKGILVIKQIIHKILQENSDYYFAFVGESLKSDGKSFIKIIIDAAGEYGDRIIYSKALRHEQLYPILKNADFLVLPSLMENLSNACIEAMALKKIVIGTDGASYEQLITDGMNGLLANINDSTTLYEKIEEAIALDEKKKHKMELAAGKRIQKLEPKYSIGKLLKFYEYVIRNGGK